MTKLSKIEIVLMLALIFSVFVTIGLKKKLHLTDINRLSTTLGIIKKRSRIETIIDLFLIGIGARKS